MAVQGKGRPVYVPGSTVVTPGRMWPMGTLRATGVRKGIENGVLGVTRLRVFISGKPSLYSCILYFQTCFRVTFTKTNFK